MLKNVQRGSPDVPGIFTQDVFCKTKPPRRRALGEGPSAFGAPARGPACAQPIVQNEANPTARLHKIKPNQDLYQAPPAAWAFRPVRLATARISASGSTGLATWSLNPAAKAR